MRRLVVPIVGVLSVVLLLLTAACSGAETSRLSTSPSTSSRSPSAVANTITTPAPFWPGAKVIPLADALRQMHPSVVLPRENVAGAPDAVTLSDAHRGGNGLYLHYALGFELRIIPFAHDPLWTQGNPSAADLALIHRGANPYLRVVKIDGRKTLVGTPRQVVRPGADEMVLGNPGPNVSWVEGAYTYRLVSVPPTAAPLAALLEVARATP
jgi:hypothetical protein